MNAQRWQKIKEIFEAAQEIAPAERARFLEKACAGDADLRRETEKLLASFEEAESFMENPAAAEALSLFEDKQTLIANHTTGNLDAEKFVAGTILASRYRIVGLLGRGGMGEVYRAEDIKLNQSVALKFLPEKLEKDAAALARFIGEVKTARQVSHQNVCKVFDIGDIDGRHFLSMEYVDGDDLSSLLRRVGRLSSERAIEISRQLCVGLHAIHEAGILHRDFKPANIIVDSKGKVRITDFGIAGFEAAISNDRLRVGTPAYMSPEQIAGREISPRSDIYALGLVLYEIFTGKQAFTADSISDLIRKQQTETPTNPSEFVKGIDPLVESVIFQCLEKKPADRPSSALRVAMALPGGNPLQVALEAGETPSPEMVAAAPKRGALKPPVAFGLLCAFFALFISLSVIHQKYKMYNALPLEKSPEVLAERSRAILQKAGYADAPVDEDFRFEENDSFLLYADKNDLEISQVKKMLGSGQPLELYFWYRRSPSFFEPKEYGRVSETEPPMTTAKMANVKLDTRGRLLEFVIVPPNAAKSAITQIDWSAFFAEAGLEISKFQTVEAKFTPPFFADERREWRGGLADFPEIPIRVEAAAFDGNPIFFRVVAPWKEPVENAGLSENTTRKNVVEETGLREKTSWKAGVFLMIGLYCFVIIGSIFLARRNLKAGRSDIGGAIKLTTVLFLLRFTGDLLNADHVPAVWSEISIIYQTFSYSLISALFIGLIYIALEPFVRRYWSELLISWNRLLGGDFRDPLVGRDVLLGGLLGLGHTVGIYTGSFLVAAFKDKSEFLNDAFSFQPVNGFSAIFGVTTGFLAGAISMSFISLFVLLGIYMLSRRKNMSSLLIFLLMFTLQSLFFVFTQHWGFILSSLINSACFTVALSRLGLVGVISFWMCFYLSYLFPVTFNTSNLYFPNTIITFIIAFGLAVYGFQTSLAEQKIFPKSAFFDEEELLK